MKYMLLFMLMKEEDENINDFLLTFRLLSFITEKIPCNRKKIINS